MLDYATLKIIWWVLIGALLIGFAIMDGHDMGVGTLLPFVGRDDVERRVIINTVGAALGRQPGVVHHGGRRHLRRVAHRLRDRVLRLLLGDAGRAVRAVLPSGRLRLPQQACRPALAQRLGLGHRSSGGAVPPLIFGVAFGNLLQGVPFHFDANMVPYYTGSFWALLNPFALLCGVVSTAMITAHGAHLPCAPHRRRAAGARPDRPRW